MFSLYYNCIIKCWYANIEYCRHTVNRSQAFSPEKTLEIPYNNELTLRNKNKGNDIQQGKHFLPLA